MNNDTKMIHRFITFGCLGITTEIFFTALHEKIFNTAIPLGERLMLQGHSYVWMLPIYGLAGFLFAQFYPLVQKYPLLLRLIIYTIGIFVIEFTAGAILDASLGKCPWEYTNYWNIMGYIRLDYTPFWMVFGFLLEKVHLELNQILAK